MLIKWRSEIQNILVQAASFFSFFFKLISNLAQVYLPVSLWKSSARVLSCVKRHESESRQTDWTQLDVNSQGEPTPLRCKNMGWPVLSEVVRPLYFIFLRLPSYLSNRAEANAGRLLNYKRWARVIPVIQSKEAGPKASWEWNFCCVVASPDEIYSSQGKDVKTGLFWLCWESWILDKWQMTRTWKSQLLPVSYLSKCPQRFSVRVCCSPWCRVN